MSGSFLEGKSAESIHARRSRPPSIDRYRHAPSPASHTESHPIVHTAPHPRLPRNVLWPYAALGLAQGLLLWLLGTAPSASAWRSAVQGLALALPLAWYLGDDAASAWRKRAVVALALGALVALLFGLRPVDGGTPSLNGEPDLLLPTFIVGFVLVTLSTGFAGGRRLSYPRLFDHAWRNAFALPVAGLLSGVWWMLLWAAAWLMQSIGLPAMQALIHQPWFGYIVGCGAFGLSIGAVLGRAEALVTLRRFWLHLNSCFLPLALGFALIWLAALLFTGVQPLFETRKAAFFLFWFCTLAVVFANAAFQDGHDAPALPAPLAWLAPYCVWAWLAVPVLALLGDWALWLRVQQYGWTVDRIWAAVVGLLVTLYALGYSASALARLPRAGRWRRWMSSLPATNIAVALATVAVLLALLSPLADSRRIAMDSQVARLLDGRVAVADFDWHHLRDGGVQGRRALKRLAGLDTADPGRRAIAERAAEESQDRATGPAAAESQLALLRKIEVLPPGAVVDPALLQWLAAAAAHDETPACPGAGTSCVFGMLDLDGDGTDEVLLLEDFGGAAHPVLYARGPDGWARQGRLHDILLPMERWKSALRAGIVKTAPPRWPDLLVDGTRVPVRSMPPAPDRP
ncbi:DUF4153 domain-containing protein [Xylophilus sp. Kf1]|nr:DUF4153 domain-containing protein [Xylophilus sp. Kf1]